MESTRWRFIGLARWALLIALAVGSTSCGGEDASQEAADAAATMNAEEPEAVDADEAVQQTTRRFLPDEMRRSTRADRFPHEAHVRIVCSVCHNAPRGHTVHDDLRCAECHRASVLGTQRELKPADCQACHHSPERNLECSACHETPAPLVTTRQIQLGVWAAPRARELPFPHVRHERLACSTCHQDRPALTASRTCASCHENHHRVDARCITCHTQPPASAHGLEAHLGCGGSGCHDAPRVEEIAQNRSVCLVCHQSQEQHEVGRECAECHQVRPGAFVTSDAPPHDPWAGRKADSR